MKYILRRRGMGRDSCRLIAQHSTTGLKVIRNDKYQPEANFLFRWGTLSNVRNPEREINSSEAIHLAANKAEFRKVLQEENLAPKTWYNGFVSYPCIVRPLQHSGGQNLYVCKDSLDLQAAIRACNGQFYASELINKKAEFRVYTVSGRAIGVSQKFPRDANSVAWNARCGGTVQTVSWDNWPLRALKSAIRADELSGLDFAALDLIVDNEDKVYVLESNSAPSVSDYRAKCFARAFDYIIANGKTRIPLVGRLGGWRKFLHPSLSSEVWL